MRKKFIIELIIFMLTVSITACSSNENSGNLKESRASSGNEFSNISIVTNSSILLNTASECKNENIKTQVQSENNSHTVKAKRILDILSTKNKDVIDSLGLSDADIIKSINKERFYVPVFLCKELGILIGFNGTQFDTIDKVKNIDETPIFVMPCTGTTISFDKNIGFHFGDEIKQFKSIFGEGKADKDWNLKGDKQYCYLTYSICNLQIRFTSLDGDDFTKYDVYIEKSQNDSTNTQASTITVALNKQQQAMNEYKKVLYNKHEFFSTDDKNKTYLNKYLKNGAGSGYPYKLTHFAVLDMDGDKIPEVILELSIGKQPEFFEVLHHMNGRVYGYNVVYRGLELLKADGTSWSSGGAADNFCNKMRFSTNGYENDILGYSESNQNNDNVTISYFINNKPVTREAFDIFIKEQNGKEDAIWYELSSHNIEVALTTQ